jgi:hypothetical protein
MLQQTFVTQPFLYRLPEDIPITGFPLAFYHPELTTAPRIYGEEWDGGTTALFLNPEDIADGYEVIWLGIDENMIRWPGYNFTWYRFNASTGEYLGRVDSAASDWLFSIFGQSRDGTLWKLRNSVTPFQAFPCVVTPTSVTPSSSASFDFTNFETVTELFAFLIDVDQNLLIANANVESNVKVWNLTTGKIIRTIALPSFATVVMAVDDRQCYVMTSTGILCLVDYQAGEVITSFAVQANGSTSPFTSYKTIAYDTNYRRFLSWNYTPVDGSGQNTSVIQGFYPVPIAVGITKPIPLRPPRKFRTVPILNRIYGDMGEACGGGVVSLIVSDPTLGTIAGFPALTDTDGESIGSLACLAPGAPLILASTDLTTGVGGTGGPGALPPPAPLPSNVRQAGDFPRLGGYLVSGSTDYDDPTRAAQIAKLDLAVLAFPPAWSGSTLPTMQQAVLAIKAINPRIVLANYTDPFQYPPSHNASAYTLVGTMAANPTDIIAAPANRPQWYVFDHSYTPKNTAAAYIPSPWGGNLINFTQWNDPPNLRGQHYNDWRANFDAVSSTGTALSLDGIYIDHSTLGISELIGPVPSGECIGGVNTGTVLGDWDRDENAPYPGSPYYGTSPPTPANQPDLAALVNQWWRSGVAAFASALRAHMGAGKFVFANTGTWNTGLPGPYTWMVNGGVIESLIGQSYSYETTSFATMLTAYRNVMAATSAPQLQIFAHDGSLTDYQDMRYGLCSCLMDNGYYYHSDGAGIGGYSNVNWFDEFDFNLGSAGLLPPPFPYQNGVYRRDFAHGIALVNPKGNGSQTVTLETSYKHLTGSQAPGVNDGSTSSSVTLADRDGIILMRVP